MQILTYQAIIKHIKVYSGIIQAYSEPCVTLTYSELWYIQHNGLFKRKVYSEPLYIHNSGISRTRDILRILSY